MTNDLTSEEVLAARQEAMKVFNNLISGNSRPVLLWLCSFLRRWEFDAVPVERDGPADQVVADAVLEASEVVPE